ncbi:MAG: glycosyltransferase [Steroidobacteraceae bacterium]
MAERGTPIAVRCLVEALCDLGHKVDLLAYPLGDDVSYPGLRLLRSPRPPLVGEVGVGISISKLVYDAWLVPRMLWLLWREKYDVVHAVEESLFPAALWSSLTGQHFVYDMDSCLSDGVSTQWRVFAPLRSLLRWIERLAVRRASLVLPVCADLADIFRQDLDSNQIVILPDFSVSTDAHDGPSEELRTDSMGSAPLCLYVGNLGRYQGIEMLLEAIALLDPSLPGQFVIIGGPDSAVRRLKVLARNHGIQGRVHFIGPRPLQALGGILSQADILISPRLSGVNTPMKIYAYMHSGVAIVATDIRSHTQVLDGTMAELVGVSAQSLADGLRSLLSDPERRQSLGESARSLVLQEYTQEAYRRRLAGAYGRLIGTMFGVQDS